MRTRSTLVLLAACVLSACSGGGLFKAYEYEEEVYLALDGTATVYVNSSVAALNALRGSSFDLDPSKRPDREAVRSFFDAPASRASRITFSRRSNRQFVHVRLEVADIARLSSAPVFAWSTYEFGRDGELFSYRQVVGASAQKDVGEVGWNGDEIVAVRMHLPSKIAYHNAGPGNPKRGNILAWEQPLPDRLRGRPLTLETRVETESILYRTLSLFGVTFLIVAALFVLLLWWIVRRGGRPALGRPVNR